MLEIVSNSTFDLMVTNKHDYDEVRQAITPAKITRVVTKSLKKTC